MITFPYHHHQDRFLVNMLYIIRDTCKHVSLCGMEGKAKDPQLIVY